MAYQDEYHFNDPDANPAEWVDPVPEDESITPDSGYAPNKAAPSTHPQLIRNGLIAVFTLVFGILFYKVIHDIYVKKHVEAPITKPIPVATMAPPAPVVMPQPKPVVTETSIDKLSLLEESQQNINTEFSTVRENVNTIESRMNDVNENIATMSRMIDKLRTQIDSQSEAIEKLIEDNKKTHKAAHKNNKKHSATIQYYLQAVIPGRAWLIAKNGATLTVRQGTKIPGYGMVVSIDAVQGRVITSNGKMIRFSQEDS